MGNVWEWTLDAYQVKLMGKEDPFWPGDPGANRVIRGGGWKVRGDLCRAAVRVGVEPKFTANDIGFRLVVVPLDVGSDPVF